MRPLSYLFPTSFHSVANLDLRHPHSISTAFQRRREESSIKHVALAVTGNPLSVISSTSQLGQVVLYSHRVRGKYHLPVQPSPSPHTCPSSHSQCFPCQSSLHPPPLPAGSRMAAVDTLIQVTGRKVNPISRLNVTIRVPPVPPNDHLLGDTSQIILPSTHSVRASCAYSRPKHVPLPHAAVSRSIPLRSSSSSAQRCVSSQPKSCDDALMT